MGHASLRALAGRVAVMAAVCAPVSAPAHGLLFGAAPGGYDFYVSQANGSDQYNGKSPETPFKTIDAALSAATNGQSIGVLPGTYGYPRFYADSDYRTGAPRCIGMAAAEGRGTVVIEAPAGDTASARIVGCLGPMWTTFAGLTFRRCKSFVSSSRFTPFLYAYFWDCAFEHFDTTNQNTAATWSYCILNSCRINGRFSGTGGSASQRESNPNVFSDCALSDCIMDLECAGQSISLSNGSDFDNCLISCGGRLRSLDLYPGRGFVDCTLIVSSLEFPDGWSGRMWPDDEDTWHPDMPAPLDGCLVAIDGYTNTHFVTDTYVTNLSAAAIIDPATLRVADTNLLAYYYGYGALEDRLEMMRNALPRTLTWCGGPSGRLSSKSWSGGAGLHTTPYPGDTLVFPSGGSFENDISGLSLAGISFGSSEPATLFGARITIVDGGIGVESTGGGTAAVDAPLQLGTSATSTVRIAAASAASLRLDVVSGPASALYAGPGCVSLRTAAAATGGFTLSNGVSVAVADGFRWLGGSLSIQGGSTLTVDGDTEFADKLDVFLYDAGGSVPARIVLNADADCDTLSVNGSRRAGRRAYGSAQSGADQVDGAHFGGAGALYVRHPVRFSIAVQ